MNEKLISVKEFFQLRRSIPMLDARSEGEFIQGNIPGAINLPILNDEERKIVGTIYKEEGSLAAVKEGFKLVGPRFYQIIERAENKFPKKQILTYCWRGGMRSEIMAWLLGMSGFEIFRLIGGYKTYRNLTYETVRKERNYLVLGGKTGVGKTSLLHGLQLAGEHIIDLEALANHKGSSFGGIGQPCQPSIEQFENLLAEKLFTIPSASTIWIENESRKIGTVILADELYQQLLSRPLLEIIKSKKERIQHIKEEYATLPEDELISAVKRLQKKLGGLRTSEAIMAIQNNQDSLWIENVLLYYDKTYSFDLEKNHSNERIQVDLSGMEMPACVTKLLSLKEKISWKKQSN
jgi:tRNA 2-selenouridine synthase